MRSRPYFLKGLIGLFGVLRGHALVPPKPLSAPRANRSRVRPNSLSAFPAPRVVGGGEQDVLDGDVVVLQLLRLGLGTGDELDEPRARALLGVPGDAGEFVEFALEFDGERINGQPGLLKDGGGRVPCPGRGATSGRVRRRSVGG